MFKKKPTTNKEVQQETHTEQTNEKTSNSSDVKTKLIFPSSWQIPIQEQYVYQYHHQQLFSLKENQLSISGVELFKDDEVAVVIGFIRNTLPKGIRLEHFVVLLLDENGSILARKSFEFHLEEEIPSLSSIPYRFVFTKEDWQVEELPEQGWSLAFEISNPSTSVHQLQLHESWEQMLSEVQKSNLVKMIQNLPALNPNEINLMGIEVTMKESQLIVTILIRNGSKENISISQLPLCVEDANGTIVAEGVFKLEDFEVSANTSKPWSFIFPENLITSTSYDLTRWKVYSPSK
ncbi:accessory Sec system S-layer assembly protein [Fictibacillus sp. 7GRE50]|uniref:accessory Sec system S-layer assembly protein n=1 Tax=Fictibacillus sp. 7GRE50 TaxID=2745878 RepID=UPI001E642EF5|nr:accessory Sec system S-layer assembly protein [Fictibacillus sp. 7GRE50]